MPNPIDSANFAQLITQAQELRVSIGEAITGYYAWAQGTATGGPNGDGYYPLSVPNGPTVLVPSPAKLADLAEAGGGGGSDSPLTAEAIMALTTLATPNDGSNWYPTVASDGTLRRGRPDMFAARRTADLVDISRLTGNELLPALTESGAGGQERRIALRELHRHFTGIINPKLPPYNCKGDLQISEGGSSTAGSNVITIKENMFKAEDVGKLIYVSNNTTGNNQYQSVITGFIDSKRVTCAANFTTDRNQNIQVVWGTDDTAGLQAAIYACRSPGTFVYGGTLLVPPGAYLTGPLKYPARMAIKGMGRRQSAFYRKPAGPGVANSIWMLQNETNMDDFNVFQDFGLHGLKYVQNASFGGLNFTSVTSATVTAQNDPYPFWSNLWIQDHAWHGVETWHRHSGDIIAMEIVGCYGAGMSNNSYDINMVNMLAIGNWGPGMIMASGGCNLNNLKLSYNGVNGYWLPGGAKGDGGCNLLVNGSGNNMTNVRLQESNSSNLVITGYYNKFGHIGIEDTGCIIPEHNTWDMANLPTLRAAVHLKGATCIDNIFMDGYYGRAVHNAVGQDHLTHAFYLSGDASNNHGRIFERTNTQFTSSRVGTSSSGGVGVTNDITINGKLLTDPTINA